MSDLTDEELSEKVNAEHAEWVASENAREDARAEWLAALKAHCIGFTPTDPNASPAEIAKELERYFQEMYY